MNHSTLQDNALHFEVPLSPSPLSRWHTSVRIVIRRRRRRRRPSVHLYKDLVRLAFVLVCDPHMEAAAANLEAAATRRWCYLCERRVKAVVHGDEGGDGGRVDGAHIVLSNSAPINLHQVSDFVFLPRFVDVEMKSLVGLILH